MGYATPYKQKFKQGQILKLERWDEDATCPQGTLMLLAEDDGTGMPYFSRLTDGARLCVAIRRLEPATYQEIKAVDPSYELKVGDTVEVVVNRNWRHWCQELNSYHGNVGVVASIDCDGDYKIEGVEDWTFETNALLSEQTEEETQAVTKQTPFQAAGYTADTVFITDRGRRVQLRRDDGSDCPFFNRAGTQDYHGVEYLSDLTVEVANEPEEVATEGVAEDNSLEGLVVQLQGAREEVARLEALLKQKTSGLGITIVVGARPSAEVVAQLADAELVETAEQAHKLKVGDKVKVSAKAGFKDELEDYDFDTETTYTVSRVDQWDEYNPILLSLSDGDHNWVPIEKFNLHKLS